MALIVRSRRLRSCSSVTVGAASNCEARVSRRGFTLGACERVFFARARVQEYRKVFADAAITLSGELIGRCADDDPVALLDRQAEQCVTDCAAHLVNSHAGIIP